MLLKIQKSTYPWIEYSWWSSESPPLDTLTTEAQFDLIRSCTFLDTRKIDHRPLYTRLIGDANSGAKELQSNINVCAFTPMICVLNMYNLLEIV